MKYTILGVLLLVLINVLPAQGMVGSVIVPLRLKASAEREQTELGQDVEKSVTVQLPPQVSTTPGWSKEDFLCLQRTIYGEARNQEFDGMLAVAAVVMNRARDPRWASTLCGVVRQKGQFAGYWHKPKLDNPLEVVAWEQAGMAAELVTLNYLELPVEFQSYLFFHEKNVKAFAWADYKEKIGDHVFYG